MHSNNVYVLILRSKKYIHIFHKLNFCAHVSVCFQALPQKQLLKSQLQNNYKNPMSILLENVLIR